MHNATQFGVLEGRRYLSLETYRKTGQAVRTPVWFAAVPGDRLYVPTMADSGKAKRLRNNGGVKVAPCDARGRVTGPWIDARAEIVAGEEFGRGMRLLDRKYFPWKQILRVFSLFGPRERLVIVIRPT